MAQVVVTIDGKTYRMACGPGEEAHLQALAADIDVKIAGLKDGVGQIGDQRLTIMAAIMTADELAEARGRNERLGAENAELKQRLAAAETEHAADQQRYLSRLETAADMLEALDGRMRGRDQ